MRASATQSSARATTSSTPSRARRACWWLACLALVIAFYDAEQRAESCNATLLALTDYLRSCSY